MLSQLKTIFIITFSTIINNFSKIIKLFADFSYEIDFNYIFYNYHYVIKLIKKIENINFKKLCFNINYKITLADRE